MYFDSLAHLLHMDGHGSYVWSAYAIGLVVILYNIIVPLLQKKRTIQHIRSRRRRLVSSKSFQVKNNIKQEKSGSAVGEGDVL